MKIKLSIIVILIIPLLSCGKIESNETEDALTKLVDTNQMAEDSLVNDNSTKTDWYVDEEKVSQSKEEVNILSDWKTIYEEFLANYEYEDKDNAEVRYEDMNNDDIPELIVFPGSADWKEYYYTITNVGVVTIGETSSSINSYYSNIEDSEYFIHGCESSTANYKYLCTLDDGKVVQIIGFECPDWMDFSIGNADEYTTVYYREGENITYELFIKQLSDLIGDDKANAFIND